MNKEEDSQLQNLATRLYDEYKDDNTKHNFHEFNPKLLVQFPNTYHYIDAIYNTSIAYNFDLTSAEENDLSTSLNILGPFNPHFTSGLSAAINRGRSSESTFTLTDTVGALLTNLGKVPYGGYYCDGHVVGENYIYPMSGEIGMQKSLKKFWELSIFANVGASYAAAPEAAGAGQKVGVAGKKGQSQADAASPTNPQSLPPVSDKLIFTTTLDLAATPKVTFSPALAANSSTLTFGPSLSRTETHDLTLAMSYQCGGQQDLQYLQNYIYGAEVGTKAKAASPSSCCPIQTPPNTSIIANPRNSGEACAAARVNQVKDHELVIKHQL